MLFITTALAPIFTLLPIFILPSISEPWGLVVEEALYFGLPVMISKNCGSVELIKNGVNGYIFEPMNSEKIKSLILNIDNILYQELIEGVREFSVGEKDLKQLGVYYDN